MKTAFYDPERSYYENYEAGPFGSFARTSPLVREDEPREVFLGLKVHTRFGIPAGPLLHGGYVKAALDKGFDLPVYKTVRTGAHSCHEYPNVLPVDVTGNLTLEKADEGLVTKDAYTEPLSITNSFGVPSYKPDEWQPDAAAAVAHAKEGQLVGVSFQGTHTHEQSPQEYIDDWVAAAKLAADTKAHFLEANLSCPNEGTTALLCFDIDRVIQIARKIKDAIGDVPLLLKISYFTDDEALQDLVKRTGSIVDGYATINTISAEVRTPDGEQALPGDGRLRSGVCGAAIKWAGLDMVQRFAAHREKYNKDFAVVGVGGVIATADYEEYLSAGADAVMSATGAMWNPELGEEVFRSRETN
ncbi:dihydroorotate oxidase [Candidatus Pacebacteria bacterium]|nr:dihydroorotate oxidase [Candidatus Paceibacterota bacterium]